MTGPTQAHGQEVFRTGKVSWNEGTSINILPTTQQGTSPQGKILEFFNPHLTHSWTQSGYLFLKSGYFFQFSRKGRRGLAPLAPRPYSLCANLQHLVFFYSVLSRPLFFLSFKKKSIKLGNSIRIPSSVPSLLQTQIVCLSHPYCNANLHLLMVSAVFCRYDVLE